MDKANGLLILKKVTRNTKVYGQQKLISFETVSKSIAAFEHTKSGMKAFQESIESIEDVMRQTAKTIDSLAKG